MDTQYDFRASFGYALLDLVILLTVTRGFHWRRVSNKPARQYGTPFITKIASLFRIEISLLRTEITLLIS